MQINFNPHLPPGYLETHELYGTSWRSERPVREALDEQAVARAVKRFEKDYHLEMERQRREGVCGTVRRSYRVRAIRLEIVRYPWDRIPRVCIQTDRAERGKGK